MDQSGLESAVDTGDAEYAHPAPVRSRKRYRHQGEVNYFPRMIGLGLGAIAVGAVLYELDAAMGWWTLLVVNGLVWPHIARLLSCRAADPDRAEHMNLLLDSALIGVWIPVMQFNLLVSVVIATMAWMDNIAVHGTRLFLEGLLASAIGVILGLMTAGAGWQPEPSLLTVACVIPMLLVYPLLVGWWSNRILQRLQEKRSALERLSQLDGLSGLNNRQYWEYLARREFSRARRHGSPCTLLLLDVDRFKEFNDAHGHLAGDEVIRSVGGILRERVRMEDMAGRYGGEEFVVVLTGTGAEGALTKAEEIRECVRRTDHQHRGLTVSIGVAELEPDMADFTNWVDRADRALYRAKALGRDRCIVDEQ